MALQRWRATVRGLKREVHALWLACRDPRTPWYARALVAVVAAYAFSPIDLIPDFIPVVGWLDDLLIVPAGILLARRLVPGHVLEEARLRAANEPARPRSAAGLAIVLGLWVLAAVAVGLLVWRRMRG